MIRAMIGGGGGGGGTIKVVRYIPTKITHEEIFVHFLLVIYSKYRGFGDVSHRCINGNR